MDIFKFSEKLMTMDDATWRRHANPWSVYTRFSCLPLLVLAVWSRTWLGWWSLVPIVLAIFWTWLNPRFFSEPENFDSWASKGVLGERIFLDRENQPIPPHHLPMTKILVILSAVGVAILIYGLVVLSFWATICGMIAAVLPKVWFVDRMVWIYDDVQRANRLIKDAKTF